MGNLELGGFYSVPLNTLQLVLRGGVVLSTADEGAARIYQFTAFGRITDLTGVVNGTTWLRLSASPVLRSGRLIFRADLGIDLAVDNPSWSSTDDPPFRVNVGVGADLGGGAITAELATIGELAGDRDLSDRFSHTLALHGEFRAGNLRPGVSLIIPLDDSINDTIRLILMAGLQAAF